ncbi:aa3-type cytochrome c oxidase subunit IV [Lichenihabitans psoromatis]|uniref:aa3-type cytochrome c oxidase subunit IV n=1 Tax=Lichenihabitans psoromatis TaxID=2528642 RepID=UPI001FE07CCC|nr:aa3-type cytochrome c oxidase subunit IV [Lichenihabitans psoromatis]
MAKTKAIMLGWMMANSDDVPMDSRYMDYAEHERTYVGFLWAAKWGTIVVAVILLLLAFFLV